MQKTISTGYIADFEIVKDSPKYHHKFQLNELETGIKFTDVVEINMLELQKIPVESDNTVKYDWLQFLKQSKRKRV